MVVAMENAVIACLVGVVASGAAGAALPGGHSATATRCWVDPVWTVDQIEVMSNIQCKDPPIIASPMIRSLPSRHTSHITVTPNQPAQASEPHPLRL